MLTQEHADSVKSYAFGAGAIVLPSVTTLTGWLQFLTALIGFIVIAHRAYHDIKSAREKNAAKRDQEQ